MTREVLGPLQAWGCTSQSRGGVVVYPGLVFFLFAYSTAASATDARINCGRVNLSEEQAFHLHHTCAILRVRAAEEHEDVKVPSATLLPGRTLAGEKAKPGSRVLFKGHGDTRPTVLGVFTRPFCSSDTFKGSVRWRACSVGSSLPVEQDNEVALLEIFLSPERRGAS